MFTLETDPWERLPEIVNPCRKARVRVRIGVPDPIIKGRTTREWENISSAFTRCERMNIINRYDHQERQSFEIDTSGIGRNS